MDVKIARFRIAMMKNDLVDTGGDQCAFDGNLRIVIRGYNYRRARFKAGGIAVRIKMRYGNGLRVPATTKASSDVISTFVPWPNTTIRSYHLSTFDDAPSPRS